MINKEAIELLKNALDEFQRLATDKFVNAATVKVRHALALLKEQPPASEYPDSEFTKVQRKAAQLAADAYEEDQEWCPTKTARLLEACDRLDASEASRKELVEVITRVTGLGCLRDRDMATCKKGDMCCICQAKAAIVKQS